ncbi:tyrosine-type recombinase/integrase [Pseudonocardia sp. HH130629-09]|uniref:tyrosine-type recombinase/integrase n=1 Tax=Pseudonocardia sp. HH130629-09 TaxID=1641402 RepID=UPI0006CB114F|nr:site-specific integrase [Pseudonocardia sp. HH130629-09]ALE82243.1 integrase [Pseudonocardia sp. HH130629-09]
MPPRRPRGRRGNGEGSIYQRESDGYWVGMAYVHTTSGQIKRRPVYGRSFEEVREKLDVLKTRSAAGMPAPDRRTTVAQFLDQWLADIRDDKRATTIRGYESAVRLHLVPALGKKRLDRLNATDVRSFMAGMREKCLCCANQWDARRPPAQQCCSRGRCCGRRPSPRQLQFVHAVLRNALGHAERLELVPRNVAKLVRVKTPEYSVGKGLPVDQVRTLLTAAEGTRFHPLYVVAATLGLRRGELLGLRWCDIDMDDATIHVRQTVQRVGGELVVEGTKTRASSAVVPLPKITRSAILARRRIWADERETAGECWQDHDLVLCTQIGTPLEPRAVNRDFDKLRVRAGLPGVRLHDLRHTVVSLLLSLGTPPHVVQAIARHADIDVTMTIYAHTNLDEMRQALDAIEWEAG